MRSRLLTAAVAAALTVPLLGQTVASAEPREVTGPSLPATASSTAADRAEDALARAQALFAEKSPAAARRHPETSGGRDATMVLNQLMRVVDDLSPADRKRARALLARPSDPGGENVIGQIAYSTGEATPVCGATICVHYANPGDADAPPDVDTTPNNGIPDEVDRALATAEHVNATYVDAGYRRPDPDGPIGGELDLVDVYLADTGKFGGVYGYCTSDEERDGAPWNRWAYCVIDDDFRTAQFPSNTPIENQRVTLAHEYFHAVQFAYDFSEDAWIMEATATWAEEQVYDGVNDNRQYISASQIRQPFIPLDVFGGSVHYGNWVFFQYLTERWRGQTGTMPTLVLDLWKRMSGRSGAPDQYSTQAIQYVLNKRNTSFTSVYGKFADANRRPQKSYSEGGAGAYRPARPAATRTLSARKRSTPKWYADLDHLTSLAVRMKPGRGLKRRDWKLRVKVDMPGATSAPTARVAVYLKNGKVSSSAVRFKKRGYSSKVLGFSARKVKYVELVVVNASRRSRCWQGTFLACQGLPRDDGRRFKFNASAFRS